MKGHELLWGDALPAVVGHIVGKAIKAGTKEAFHDASQKLSGITSFIIFMNLGPGWDTDAIVTLNAEYSRMARMVWDDQLRESVLKLVDEKLSKAI